MTWDAEPLELDSTRTFLGRVSLEYREWWNQFPLRRRTVKQIEDAPKNPVTGRLVQFLPRRTVVAVVGKLPRVQVNAVRPVLLLSSGKKRDKLLVPPFACQPKAAHVSAARQKSRDRVRGELACALVHRINN